MLRIASSFVFVLIAACGGGPDTGFLRLQEVGSRVGYQSYHISPSTDRWCLFPAATGYKAPSVTNPVQMIQFMYRGTEWLPDRPASEPAWPSGSRRLRATITVMAASGSTQPNGAEPPPTKSQPFGVGRYRLKQKPPGGTDLAEVGALLVEPYQGETRQHWFLFGGGASQGQKAPFTEPSEANQNVSTQFEYVSGDVYSVNLSTFQGTLGWSPIEYRRVVLVEDNF